MLEAVGWEKGTFESSIGEDAVDERESGRSEGSVVSVSAYSSKYTCQIKHRAEHQG